MKTDMLNLKKLNAAYKAALEFDYCPDGGTTDEVAELYNTGLDTNVLKEALNENQGRRPDEIADEMSDIISSLVITD